jgi:GNAT superfamily N-acetyltransferase
MLVADLNGVLAGYIAGKFEVRPLGRPRRIGHIMDAFVRPSRRRRGVGVALVMGLLDWFERRRVEDVSVRFVVRNLIARSFWMGLGFRPLFFTGYANPRKVRRRIAGTLLPRVKLGSGG